MKLLTLGLIALPTWWLLLKPRLSTDVSMIRHDKSDETSGGGVCVYVKDFLPLTLLNHHRCSF